MAAARGEAGYCAARDGTARRSSGKAEGEFMEHDPFRKPVPTPHQVRGRLFRDHALKRNDQNERCAYIRRHPHPGRPNGGILRLNAVVLYVGSRRGDCKGSQQPQPRFRGLALIEEAESTAVVAPIAEVTVDRFDNLIMRIERVAAVEPGEKDSIVMDAWQGRPRGVVSARPHTVSFAALSS
jgi:hypothetical protein